jgi:putative mRNA 3-end processing factor
MKIRFLGGCREVGKSAVLLEGKKERVILDYGLEIEEGKLPINPGKVHTILLTHAHLDHIGGCPSLWRDNMKVTRLRGLKANYNRKDLNKTINNEVRVTYGQQIETKDSVVDVFDAGHIPGSSAFLVDIDGIRVLYTGD